MNVAQHKIVNLLKTFFFFCSSIFVSVCILNVWPKTTPLPLWPRCQKFGHPMLGVYYRGMLEIYGSRAEATPSNISQVM